MDRTKFSKQSEEEAITIFELIPKDVSSPEEKRLANQKIRDLLPLLSNDAITLLFCSHQMSFVELRRRISLNLYNDLSELFRLIERYLYRNGKAVNKLFGITYDRAVEISTQSSTLEIAEILRDFGADRVGDDFMLCEEILKKRTDLDEILALINSFPLYDNDLFKLRCTIESVKK